MCLLTFIPEYTQPDIDLLATGALNNPDGFGYAIHTGRNIIHNSGLKFIQIADEFLSLRDKYQGPALFHSRITTHGGTTVENCHPFQVGRDELTVVAHNGMLPIAAKNGKSDTRIFAEEMFPAWGGASTLNSKKMRKKLAKFASGSKLVFLSANPDVQNDFTIINERDGHWDSNGVWWSNNSYKYERYTYSGGGMYTSGWSKTDKGVYTPSDTDYDDPTDSPYVIDCSYEDHNGDTVWEELWICATCGYTHTFNETNINDADLCPQCDTCWFCFEDRMMCSCYPPQSDLVSQSAHSIGNYDSPIDFF